MNINDDSIFSVYKTPSTNIVFIVFIDTFWKYISIIIFRIDPDLMIDTWRLLISVINLVPINITKKGMLLDLLMI